MCGGGGRGLGIQRLSLLVSRIEMQRLRMFVCRLVMLIVVLPILGLSKGIIYLTMKYVSFHPLLRN